MNKTQRAYFIELLGIDQQAALLDLLSAFRRGSEDEVLDESQSFRGQLLQLLGDGARPTTDLDILGLRESDG